VPQAWIYAVDSALDETGARLALFAVLVQISAIPVFNFAARLPAGTPGSSAGA
jgi:hypothetical protein